MRPPVGRPDDRAPGVSPRRALAPVALALLAGLAHASPALADEDDPPSVRRGQAPPSGSPDGGPVVPAGEQGLRPFFGIAGHLDVDIATPAGGNKILFGLDYMMGGPTGLAVVLGMHLGAGGRAFLLYPLVELHYRFATPLPLVPYIGGGAGVRIAFARGNDVNIALGLRFVAGLEYFITPSIAVGTQLALPDIGPRLTPDIRPVGTLEWTFGPAFRF